MVDWTKSMQQTFEYYLVNPDSWKDSKRLDNIIKSTISRDSEATTLGSLDLQVTDEIGECYIRVYLVTIQNEIREKHPLGTFMVQTPNYNFNGKYKSYSVDGYTPLIELKEKQPPLGYSIIEGENIMSLASRLIRENARAPVVPTEDDTELSYDFVANIDDTWAVFIRDLIANAKYDLGLDELGKIMFTPVQDIASLQPVWTFDDNNSSILYPDLDVTKDLYGVPNVVEVIYSNNNDIFYSKVVNDDPNSPISTINRGREILYRDTNPNIIGNISQQQVDVYAKQLLKSLSCLEYRLTYTHGYCPVRIGDCVRLNYSRAGLNNIKAKIVSQSIDCVPGCPVTETAIFTNMLWSD